ncbi:MAG TPA: two-component regulator propeller domain-containing protein [Blastocatellia bacterium]|nr:two-component regulator propeller domain-containing protein [Blastocatellia bacterium]
MLQPIAGATVAAARYLSVWLLLLAALPARAQQISVRRYDVSDGLAHSRVTAIHQDRKGYLWFGTWEGLSRFDGYRFTNYGERDGLGHVIINDITEDRRGRLWVATNGGGVACLIDDPREVLSSDPSKSASAKSAPAGSAPGVRRKFINFRVGDSPNSNQVNALLFDADDNLWLATDDGLYRASAGSSGDFQSELIAPQKPSINQRVAFADRSGRLWFEMENEIIQVVRGQVIKYGPKDEVGRHRVMSVTEDRRGRILVANEREVFEFVEPCAAGNRGRWRRVPLIIKPDEAIQAMLSDSTGALWIGASNGLIKRQDGKQTIYTDAQGLSNNSILALMEDRDGNLWVGTEEGGVCKLSGERIVSFTRTEGMPNQSVFNVIEDSRGRIYASVANGGLVEIVEGRAVLVPGSSLPPFNTSTPYKDSRDNWWISTAKGLFYFEGSDLQLRRGRKLSEADGVGAEEVNAWPAVTKDPFENLWIMLGKSLYRLNLARMGRPRLERVTLNATLPLPVLWMMGDRAGTLWLGGHRMLARFMKGKTTILQAAEGLPETSPRAFFQDSRGWLWIGLRYKGVSVTKDPTAETPKFVNYSTEQGLSSDTVWAVTEDDAGRIYLGTGNGLDQLDPVTGRIRHFSVRDGLAGAVIRDCLKDRNGAIWVATALGLSKFNPRAERGVDHPPPIYLSRAQVAGEDLPLAETGAPRIPELEIPSTRNNLLVEYVGLSFRGEHRLRYQYKLDGVDEDWSAPTESRSVNYARLAPGSYQFMARAINQEGTMSPEPAMFRFRILPPLWQRWWFLALAATLTALACYAFYRYRTARLVELERVRTRIATDLHDDIGANLTKIAILSEVAQQRLGAESQLNGSPFSSIAGISRESVAAMSDIVWAINPKRDSLRDLARRMRGFASEVFSSRNIEFRFHTLGLEQDLKLGPDLRRDVYLIFKEAVNNVVRHAACARAEIELRLEGNHLTLRVRDDGRGFDPERVCEGNGLESMTRRAKAMGGALETLSQPGRGTIITLRVPAPRRSRILARPGRG